MKFLGLGAELQDDPFVDAQPEEGLVEHTLGSGTKLVMTSEAFDAYPGLLNPQEWESRRQLKDRVYRATVNEQEVIVKERKTARHTDVKRGGHVDGLTSQQEFDTAREFADLGTISEGDIRLRWERPIGYAEFPDGYQFCLFESEPDLATEPPQFRLSGDILDSAEEHQAEFELVKQRAKEIYKERKDLVDGIGDDELTFEEFAEVKTHAMITQAKGMLEQTMEAAGYVNDDTNGFGFTIDNSGRRPVLQIIGFDFEYYKMDAAEAKRLTQLREKWIENGDNAEWSVYKEEGRRAIMRAASYGMMEQIGYTMPGKSVDTR